MFVPAAEAVREKLDWGSLAWCCRPSGTGSQNLTVIEVTLAPGGGHAFHKHPKQEEVIYVVDGQVEQWLDKGKRVLSTGDSVYIPAGTVHASFNTGARDAKLLAILGPCVGRENGYEVIEVADQAPWKGLR
ncbi:MAG: cupin domain-containing protein [Thermoguttaceae bacterium]|jgi:quercetin dioxygenase-like cupin family protein|nr:cupin domain-containing protein [Thermoguttaceae bacterium]